MKTWFITGASRGFGRIWAEAALQRGDRVVATARDVSTLDDLVATYGDRVLALELDVTDKSGGEAAIRKAAEHFGRIDVLVNNAGYGVLGAVEEVSEEQFRTLVETNLMGPLWLSRAVLPIMRAQGGGHILQVSSQTVHFQVPTLGTYQISKWGLEGFSESLAAEVAGHGIKVTIIEPEGYSHRLGRVIAAGCGGHAGVRRGACRHAGADGRHRAGRPAGDSARDLRCGRCRGATASALPGKDTTGPGEADLRRPDRRVGRLGAGIGFRLRPLIGSGSGPGSSPHRDVGGEDRPGSARYPVAPITRPQPGTRLTVMCHVAIPTGRERLRHGDGGRGVCP